MARLKNRIGSIFGRGATQSVSRPLLSVVIPVHNVSPYLAECLDSILGQTLDDLEVIAVDDGSTDDSLSILREYAARDPRVQVLTQPNAGQGAARNAAMAQVRGEFLAFADSDDVVPADAYAAMVATLRETGSDWILGGAQRYTHGQLLEVVRGTAVHDRDRLRLTIDDFPIALHDIIPGNRLFRTAFYRERVPPYRTDVKYEDQVPCLAAFVRGRFDVLERVTYWWRIREDASSTTQQKTTLRNLRDQVEVMHESLALMRGASPAAYASWVGRMIGLDLNGFVQPALGADDEFREMLSAAYRTMLAEVTPPALAAATVSAKVRAHLVAGEDWEGLLAFEEYAQQHGRVPPTRVVEGRVLADPGTEEPWPRIPAQMWELGAHETPLRAAVHHVAVSNGVVHVHGYAGIGAVDCASYPPVVTAQLGALPLTVSMEPHPNADVWAKDPNTGFADGAFVASAPLDELAVGTSVLRLRVTQAGLVREGAVHEIAEWSGAARTAHPTDAGRSVVPGMTETGFAVTVTNESAAPPQDRPRLLVTGLRVGAEEIELDVLLDGLTPDEVAGAVLGTKDVPVAHASSFDGRTLRFPTTVSLPGAPDVALEPRGTSVRVLRPGRPPVLAEPAPGLGAALPLHAVGPSLRVSLRMRPNGQAAFLIGAPLALEEVTRVGRGRLRAAYRTSTAHALAGAVLLQCDEGHRVDGAALALDRAIAHRRPDLTRYWSVQSHHTAVPEGAVALPVGSGRWYDALRDVPLLITDSSLGEWFVKRSHQRLVRLADWPVAELGPAHDALRAVPVGTAALRARQVQDWDLLVAPTGEAADIVSGAWNYTGPRLAAALMVDFLRAAPQGQGAAVRAALGLAPESKVVLYAPTYRDTRSHRVDAAPMYDGLDLAGLAERLGPTYTVLLRAHRYDARTAEQRARRAGILDVSDYPRLGDLMLAADAAVLDYGAERMEWALTGRPAVFFTRDRAAYFDVRAPLLDYDATRCGPTATSTEQVAELLADLPALATASRPLAARVLERSLADADGRSAERVVERLSSWL